LTQSERKLCGLALARRKSVNRSTSSPEAPGNMISARRRLKVVKSLSRSRKNSSQSISGMASAGGASGSDASQARLCDSHRRQDAPIQRS
jgi:hypothetical protein